MSFNSQIVIHQLSFILPNGNPIFNSLDLAINEGKVGLIGKNGIGKSTLLKLIAGELTPTTGSIEIAGKIAYLPQNYEFAPNATVADVLDIKNKLDALDRILQGSSREQDSIILNDDWAIKERAQKHLAEFNLADIELSRPIKNLSGGEITRLRLAKLFISDAAILLLDEPTNNLDATTRQLLYQALEKSKALQLIVSHDRTLLSMMNEIIELTSLGFFRYGGNYQAYLEQKAIASAAKQQQLDDAKKFLGKTDQSIQASREKHEQRRSKGIKLRKTGKIDKLSANTAKGRSERSQSRLVTQKDHMLKKAETQWQEAKEKVEISEEIKINLPKTYVPQGKTLLKIEELTFSYSNQEKTLIANFDLTIQGPERIALSGNNGSGKTTLVKLILDELTPQLGTVQRGTQHISYLDQQTSLLKSKLTLLENFLRINPDMTEREAYHCLAQFLFRNTQALKKVENLNGGERLRAALTCILLSAYPPQLLILDEPTNHLDLKSIASLESALNCYQGAMIVISHDQTFLKNINIQRTIMAPFINN
jgi:ATPase subunit of ABC transporter with duplicated ATPase domains